MRAGFESFSKTTNPVNLTSFLYENSCFHLFTSSSGGWIRFNSPRSFCLTTPPSQRHFGSLPPTLTTLSAFYAARRRPSRPPSSVRPLAEPSPLKWAKLRSGGECKSCLVWIRELQRDFSETRRGQKQTLAKLSAALMMRKCFPGITNPCLACAFSSTSYC